MRVKELIQALEKMPHDAPVALDAEGFPEVVGVYTPSPDLAHPALRGRVWLDFGQGVVVPHWASTSVRRE